MMNGREGFSGEGRSPGMVHGSPYGSAQRLQSERKEGALRDLPPDRREDVGASQFPLPYKRRKAASASQPSTSENSSDSGLSAVFNSSRVKFSTSNGKGALAALDRNRLNLKLTIDSQLKARLRRTRGEKDLVNISGLTTPAHPPSSSSQSSLRNDEPLHDLTDIFQTPEFSFDIEDLFDSSPLEPPSY